MHHNNHGRSKSFCRAKALRLRHFNRRFIKRPIPKITRLIYELHALSSGGGNSEPKYLNLKRFYRRGTRNYNNITLFWGRYRRGYKWVYIPHKGKRILITMYGYHYSQELLCYERPKGFKMCIGKKGNKRIYINHKSRVIKMNPKRFDRY